MKTIVCILYQSGESNALPGKLIDTWPSNVDSAIRLSKGVYQINYADDMFQDVTKTHIKVSILKSSATVVIAELTDVNLIKVSFFLGSIPIDLDGYALLSVDYAG